MYESIKICALAKLLRVVLDGTYSVSIIVNA